MMKQKWKIYKASYFKDGKWIEEFNFYIDDNTNWHDEDWRICEVKGRRTKSELMGTIGLSNEDFPIKYPLILDNGYTLLRLIG